MSKGVIDGTEAAFAAVHLYMKDEDNAPCVLVVEDDPVVMRICRAVLERDGYTVLSAVDAEEAMQLASSRCIALALIDLVVPGVEAMRKSGMTGPVVCMSGYPLALLPGAENMRLPSPYFLAKPFTPAELTALVRGALKAA